MHVYIYDSFLNQKKYDSMLSKIEIRITDLGLNGKITRLGVMKNVRETIENEVKRGAKTIVVVGNDLIMNEAINVMAGQSVPLAIIPVDDGPNLIAKALGINFGEKACDVLSARIIEKFDVISINNYFFLTEASITTDGTVIEINQNYSIEADERGEVKIINMATKPNKAVNDCVINPQDGKFELIIETMGGKGILSKSKITGESVFSLNFLNISNSKNFPLIAGVKEISLPAEVKILENGLRLIVGKNRYFKQA